MKLSEVVLPRHYSLVMEADIVCVFDGRGVPIGGFSTEGVDWQEVEDDAWAHYVEVEKAILRAESSLKNSRLREGGRA